MPTIAFGDQVWDAADPIFEEDEGHFRVEDIVTVVEHEHVKETDLEVDTIDANEQLGFDADERVYLPAAQILRLLGFGEVRLMTNNPNKVSALSNCGIVVEERVPHAFPSNEHNESYLRTKAARGGHVF